MIKINIHSMVDVITNSSTELFCTVNGKSEDQIVKILDDIVEKEFGCTAVKFYVDQAYEEGDDFLYDKAIEGRFDISYDWETGHEPCSTIKNRIKEIFGE